MFCKLPKHRGHLGGGASVQTHEPIRGIQTSLIAKSYLYGAFWRHFGLLTFGKKGRKVGEEGTGWKK